MAPYEAPKWIWCFAHPLDPVFLLSPLDFLIFIPILAALSLGLGARARRTALAAAVGNILIVAWLCVQFDASKADYQFTASRTISTAPHMAYAVGLDGLSLILVVLTALVTFCALWIKPVGNVSDRMWYGSSLLIAAGGMGAFVATDVFFLYAFHELALIPTFLMIGLYGHGGRENRLHAAWKITIYLGLGSLILLAGLVWMVIQGSPASGMTFDLIALKQSVPQLDAGTQASIFLTLFIGFGVLISLFPFHSWAAPAYAAAPTPIAMLHAGVLKKFGLYGLLRIALPLLPAGAADTWNHQLMLWLLLGNIILIGLVTLAQKSLDQVLGHSSVMHMGYAFLGIASGSAIGFNGALVLMFAHGVSIALLFALAGHIRVGAGTLDLNRLGGLAKRAPVLGLIFGMAAMAALGLPGFANFAAEVMIFLGGFQGSKGSISPLQAATIFALWGVVISAVYMLRTYRKIFMGPPGELPVNDPPPLTASDRVPLFLLLGALLVVGFQPNLLIHLSQPVIEALTNR